MLPGFVVIKKGDTFKGRVKKKDRKGCYYYEWTGEFFPVHL